MKSWVLAAPLLLSAITANATMMTIDPDSVSSGTNISQQFEGVTLSTLVFGNGTMVEQDMFALGCGTSSLCASAGSNLFGYQTPTGFSTSFTSVGGTAQHCLDGTPASWCVNLKPPR